MSRCIVHGCQNCKSEGRFVGDICGPCYMMLTTGVIGKGTTFIHQIKEENNTLRNWIEALAKQIHNFRNQL